MRHRSLTSKRTWQPALSSVSGRNRVAAAAARMTLERKIHPPSPNSKRHAKREPGMPLGIHDRCRVSEVRGSLRRGGQGLWTLWTARFPIFRAEDREPLIANVAAGYSVPTRDGRPVILTLFCIVRDIFTT